MIILHTYILAIINKKQNNKMSSWEMVGVSTVSKYVTTNLTTTLEMVESVHYKSSYNHTSS